MANEYSFLPGGAANGTCLPVLMVRPPAYCYWPIIQGIVQFDRLNVQVPALQNHEAKTLQYRSSDPTFSKAEEIY